MMMLVMLLLPAAASSQDLPKTTPIRPRSNPDSYVRPRSATPTTGQIYVGDRAPDFELDRSDGRAAKLSSFRGQWTLLIFANRRDEIAAFRVIEPELTSSGIQIVGVCHEKTAALKSVAARDTVRYALLSDQTGEVSAMYGLYDPLRSETLPGFLVLDPPGVVRVTLLGKAFPPEDIAKLVEFIVGTRP
jgi:peroxiredoxin